MIMGGNSTIRVTGSVLLNEHIQFESTVKYTNHYSHNSQKISFIKNTNLCLDSWEAEEGHQRLVMLENQCYFHIVDY